MNRILLPDMRATERLAGKMAAHLRAGQCLLLEGDLGVGKTAFARALLKAMGVEGEIPSPTFTLMQIYELPHLSIFHFDLYRVEAEDEMEELGFDDALAGGLVLVEWPERAPAYMPQDALKLSFSFDFDGRRQVEWVAPDELAPAWRDILNGL